MRKHDHHMVRIRNTNRRNRRVRVAFINDIILTAKVAIMLGVVTEISNKVMGAIIPSKRRKENDN